MLNRRVYEGEVVICWDSPGEPVVLRREHSDLTMEALSNIIANNYLGNRVRVTIEKLDAEGGKGDNAYNDGILAAIVDGRRRP